MGKTEAPETREAALIAGKLRENAGLEAKGGRAEVTPPPQVTHGKLVHMPSGKALRQLWRRCPVAACRSPRLALSRVELANKQVHQNVHVALKALPSLHECLQILHGEVHEYRSLAPPESDGFQVALTVPPNLQERPILQETPIPSTSKSSKPWEEP